MSAVTHEIRLIRSSDLTSVARVHLAAFPKSALTQLGEEAVRRYYDWLLVGPHRTTALGAFQGETLVAFLFGGTFNGAMTGFIHRNRTYLVAHVATHPWLLGTPLVRDRIVAALRLLRNRTRVRRVSDSADSAPPAFGVLAIAVEPKVQGSGAGRALMREAEKAATSDSFTTMELTVAAWNRQAIAFYERGGWNRVVVNGDWKGGLMRKLIEVP